MNKASNIITIKGQPAAVTFEADINAFRGKFLNVNGYCDFVATSIEALYREGESALDEWMADCEEDGIAPFREEEEQKRLTLRVPHQGFGSLSAARAIAWHGTGDSVFISTCWVVLLHRPPQVKALVGFWEVSLHLPDCTLMLPDNRGISLWSF